MATISEVKNVEIGKHYIVINPFGDGRRHPMYVKIEVWKQQHNRIMFSVNPAWWDYKEAVAKGARFFGPLEIEE